MSTCTRRLDSGHSEGVQGRGLVGEVREVSVVLLRDGGMSCCLHGECQRSRLPQRLLQEIGTRLMNGADIVRVSEDGVVVPHSFEVAVPPSSIREPNVEAWEGVLVFFQLEDISRERHRDALQSASLSDHLSVIDGAADPNTIGNKRHCAEHHVHVAFTQSLSLLQLSLEKADKTLNNSWSTISHADVLPTMGNGSSLYLSVLPP